MKTEKKRQKIKEKKMATLTEFTLLYIIQLLTRYMDKSLSNRLIIQHNTDTLYRKEQNHRVNLYSFDSNDSSTKSSSTAQAQL